MQKMGPGREDNWGARIVEEDQSWTSIAVVEGSKSWSILQTRYGLWFIVELEEAVVLLVS
jgi:hypothetical protein